VGLQGGEGGILYERNRIFTASSVPRIFSFSLLLLLLPSIIVPTDRPTTRLLRIRGSFSKRRLFPVVAVLTSPPLLVYSADRGVGLVVGFRHHLFRVRSSNTHVSRAGGRVCPACTVPFFQIAGVVRREESAKIRVFYSSGLPRPLVRSTEDLCLHGHLLKEKKNPCYVIYVCGSVHICK
jgi:hypothetical protein